MGVIVIFLLKSNIARRGGLEKFALRAAEYLNYHGASVTLLTNGDIPDFIAALSSSKFKIISLHPRRPLSVWDTLTFDKLAQRFLKNHPYHAVFGLDRNSYQTHLRLGNGLHEVYLQKRVLYEESSQSAFQRTLLAWNPLHRTLLSLEKQALNQPKLQRVWVNSLMVYQEVIDRYPHLEEKIQLLINPLKSQQFSYSRFINHDKLVAGPMVFSMVGHNFERKGLRFLIAVLEKIRHLPWRCHIVGHDRHQARWRELLKQKGMEERFIFDGTVEDTAPYYAETDVLLVPSSYDPFANVTLEGLASGCRVITSCENGAKWLVQSPYGVVLPLKKELWVECLIQEIARGKRTSEERINNHQIFSLWDESRWGESSTGWMKDLIR